MTTILELLLLLLFMCTKGVANRPGTLSRTDGPRLALRRGRRALQKGTDFSAATDDVTALAAAYHQNDRIGIEYTGHIIGYDYLFHEAAAGSRCAGCCERAPEPEQHLR